MTGYTKLFALLLLLLAFSANADSIGANVSLISEEWVYFALWKLEANGLTGPIFANSRPYDPAEISQVLASMREKIDNGQLEPDPLEMQLIEKLEAEVSPSKNSGRLEARGILSGRINENWDSSSLSLWSAASFNPISNVTLYDEVNIVRGAEVIGEEGETASRRTNRWKWDYTADFRRAYVSYNSGRFKALFGREPLFWGPGYGGSLIISDNSPAFDMLLLSARFGPVKAIAFSAMLDQMWGEHGNPPQRYLANRYLSGHRVDWMVNDRIELGLSEVVLYGGDARGMEFQYMNPLLPYYATQWNSATISRDDNVMACAEFAIRPVDRMKIYGQLLVDDFSYSGGDPNALGYIAGLYVSDPLGFSGVDLRAEYTRVDSWAYTHLEPDKQFTHYGWTIGHHLGPDADQILVEPSLIINVDTRLKMRYTFEREGSRAIADRFRGEDYKRMDFPSGEVQQRHGLRLNFLWEPLSGPRVSVSWKSTLIRDQGGKNWENNLSIKAGFLYDMRWNR